MCGGAVTVAIVGSLFIHPTDAPAHAPASLQISAGADRLAVLDGETLRVGDQVVRLGGVAAPARGSVCHGDGSVELDCGVAAANALASLVRGQTVACTISGHDRQERPVGDCLAGGRKLSEALVLDGWARAEYASLRDPETTARSAGRGMWRTGVTTAPR